MKNRFKFYVYTILICFVGYSYLFYSYRNTSKSNFSFCFYKNIISLPCPACGTTRGIFATFSGNLYQAFFTYNPLGILQAIFLSILPIMLLVDLLFTKNYTLKSYNFLILQLQKKKIWIPIVLLLILNWIWNYYKKL